MLRLPTGYQGAEQLLLRLLKADDFSTPVLADLLHSAPERTQRPSSGWPIGPTGVDPQKGMPASDLNRLIQPAGVEAPIRQNQHCPVSRNTRLHLGKEG